MPKAVSGKERDQPSQSRAGERKCQPGWPFRQRELGAQHPNRCGRKFRNRFAVRGRQRFTLDPLRTNAAQRSGRWGREPPRRTTRPKQVALREAVQATNFGNSAAYYLTN